MQRLQTDWTRLLHVDLLGAGALVAGTRGSLALPHVDMSTLRSGARAMLHRAAHALRSAWIAHCARRRARLMRDELAGLDDRMLRDLGMSRDEISSVVAELAGAAMHTRRQTLAALHDAHWMPARDGTF